MFRRYVKLPEGTIWLWYHLIMILAFKWSLDEQKVNINNDFWR